jgi:pyruvate dehydrogenase E2 component (dihydrolipoamide acetyltransferase)
VDDLSEGTFTITNLGMYEIEEFLPIVNLPECAIMGIGTILKKPVAVNDKVEIRPRMIVTLAFDHRLVDGAPAARFLQRIKHLIEEPLELLD